MHSSLISLQPTLHRLIKDGYIKIILASASPRRSEALNVMLGGAQYFEVVGSEFDEKLPHSDYDSALAYCLETAKRKAQNICAKLKHTKQKTLVIAADTVVAFNDHILEKPTSIEDAKRMLHILSGSKHEIHTCVTVYMLPEFIEAFSFTTTTVVKFADLTDEEINAYVASGEPLDKAGAYAIQGQGRMLIEYIEGDFFGGVGFPARDFAWRFADLLTSLATGALRNIQ